MNKLYEIMFRWRVIWYFIPYLVALTSVYSSSNVTPNIIIFLLGVSFSIIGQAIRLWAAGFVEKVARKNTVSFHTLITSGPYQYIRHPLYLGNILGMIGFGISAAAFLAFPVNIEVILICTLLAASIFLLILMHEEPMLLRLHGENYNQYSQKTPRLIPAFRVFIIKPTENNFSLISAMKNETHVIIFKIVLYVSLFTNLPN